MTMTNAEFARIATQIAARASGWAHDGLAPPNRPEAKVQTGSALWFTTSIREMCDRIDEGCGGKSDARTGGASDA